MAAPDPDNTSTTHIPNQIHTWPTPYILPDLYMATPSESPDSHMATPSESSDSYMATPSESKSPPSSPRQVLRIIGTSEPDNRSAIIEVFVPLGFPQRVLWRQMHGRDIWSQPPVSARKIRHPAQCTIAVRSQHNLSTSSVQIIPGSRPGIYLIFIFNFLSLFPNSPLLPPIFPPITHLTLLTTCLGTSITVWAVDLSVTPPAGALAHGLQGPPRGFDH